MKENLQEIRRVEYTELMKVRESIRESFELKEEQEMVDIIEVNPETIDQSLFENKRSDENQEKTRKIILDALIELKKNPEKYVQRFELFVPKKKWEMKTVGQLKELASNFGNGMADWVYLSLEWAQRISRGGTWEALCNDNDISKWCRLILWKDGSIRINGGSSKVHIDFPVSDVGDQEFTPDIICGCSVPLIVRYK